jgi:hypothetical protein
MTTLLNDVIIKTGIIEHIGSTDRPAQYFTGLTFSRMFFVIVLPIFVLILLSFILKRRYDAKKAKDDIILNGFYDPID